MTSSSLESVCVCVPVYAHAQKTPIATNQNSHAHTGAVVFDFDIPKVVGIAGASVALAEPCGRGAYVAGAATRSMAWIRRMNEYDSLGVLTRRLSWQVCYCTVVV
jgi:hypothetical protein